MRYPSPVPTQRADYKSAEAKAIALWSRERDGLAYHHRIERNRVYLTVCIVSHVCCVFCLQWGGREGQGGATHKKIGPSDGGRLLYRLYFNADRTCNTKEKKKLNRNKDKQSTTEAFHGRRKLSLFFISMAVASTFFGIQKDWAFPFWYEIYAKQTQHFFWHLTHHSSLALGTEMDMHTEELRISPWILYISSPSLISRRLIFRTCTAPLHCENLLLAKGKWEILFTSQSLSVWIFFSFLLAESLTSLWNVNASLTRPFPKHFLTFGTRHVTRTALQFNRLTIEVHALNFHPFQIFCWF